ncbi:hypothetical protein [Croceivirga sp. JEA036]|uniref:hypothetical protein n=1 Tax=Croceivirga sp. JEA036 TaxID=2721162 RepID=UPI001439C041|nr:hypothetical protein [Croceivirga sp. JEA036]NJB38101.1 hypothetical protein [Croceivirga sp. JEA036]
MKIKKYLIVAFIGLVAFSCSDNTDTGGDILEDEGKGVERFIVSSVTQVVANESNSGIVVGNIEQNNILNIQGYVMPEYTSSVTVTARVAADSDVEFSYNGISIEEGEEFLIEEWFTDGSFFNLIYEPKTSGDLNLNITFTNSLGTTLTLTQYISVE